MMLSAKIAMRSTAPPDNKLNMPRMPDDCQSLLHRLQIMPKPHAAHAERRYRNALLLQFIGDTHLPPGWSLDRHLDHGLLNLRIDTVLLDRLAARDLGGKCQLAAFFLELLKPIETIAAISHHLACLRHAAELLGEFH